MTHRTATTAMLVAFALSAAIALGLYFFVRPDVLTICAELGVMPGVTRVVASPWVLPGSTALGVALLVAAFRARTRARQGRLMALAVTIVGLAVVLATWGFFVPLFERA